MKSRRPHWLAVSLFVIIHAAPACRAPSIPTPPAVEPASESASKKSSATDSSTGVARQEPNAQTAPADISPLAKVQPQRHLPESIVSAPEKESAPLELRYDTVLFKRSSPMGHLGWQYRTNRQNKIVGFEFSNRGGNRILPKLYDVGKNLFYTRDFQFRFDERARQDMHLMISDWVASRDKQFRLSELMNSVMLFFPRSYLPAVVTTGARNIVTLPTGEEVEFDARTNEVAGGVFSEAPVDLSPDRSSRRFPDVSYIGKAVLIRADARGTDPRLAAMAVITTGSPSPDCQNGLSCRQCEVPAKELWLQSGAVRFKFVRDEDFNRYLLSRCGFGLPMAHANS